MSKRLMPTYLVKFLEKIYDGEIPSNFGKRMVSRQFIARAKELYDTLGGKNPSDYSRRMVNEYLIKFFNEIEIVEYDDDDISQTKTIPSDLVYPACRIDSIGGMSYKSENLIDTTDYTLGGDAYNATITFTKQLEIGKTYTLSFNNSISSNVTLTNATLVSASGYISRTYITFTPTDNNVVIKFAGGSESNPLRDKLNAMAWFMLNVGSTALPYEPYFEGIRDSAVTAVKSYGANVFNFNENVVSVSTSTTPLSINLNIDATTKTIGANATGTYSRAIIKLSENLITGKTYTFSFNLVTNVAVGRIALSSTGSHIDDKDYGYLSGATSGSKTLTFTAVNNKLYLHLYLTTSNSSCDMTMSNIMLNYGSTALPYTPYKGLIDTYTVPSAITSLEGYGQGINSTVYNNVDFASGKYTKKIGVVDLGTLDYDREYHELANIYRFFTPFSQGKIPTTARNTNVLSAPYHTNPDPNVNEDLLIFIASNGNLYVYNNAYTSATEFKAAMDGVLLYYELATPVETAITENAPLLEVESGGTVVLENEYNNNVPSEVVTWIKEN